MKIDRLVSMIMILLEKERVGAKELAAMFEVSPRTIYRDMDAISMAGIPIRATAGVGGGFEIMREYKVNQRVFSSADLSTILMGLSNLSPLVQGDGLASTLAKVKSFIPEAQAQEIAAKASQIQIDVSPWLGGGNQQQYLDTIQAALQEHRLLSFEYADRHGNKTARRAEPYQLVLKNSHWYWQGYCHTRLGYRLFRLSRMANLRMETETFLPREFAAPVLDFAEALQTLQTSIRLRIHAALRERVLDLCAPEHFTPEGEGYYLVDFPFIENDFYYNILLGFGDKCECLGPSHVRTEMKRRIQALASLYEGEPSSR